MSKKKMTRYEKQMKKFLDQKRMKGGTRRAVEISIEGRKMALWETTKQISIDKLIMSCDRGLSERLFGRVLVPALGFFLTKC